MSVGTRAWRAADGRSPRVQAGPDQDRAARLFDLLGHDIYAYAARRCPPDVAQDVVSETFITVVRRTDQIPTAPDEARAWVFGVARNQLAHAQRARARQGMLDSRLATAALAGTPVLEPDVAAAVVERTAAFEAFSALPPRDQEILTLVAWEGLDSRQAGTVLGLSPSAFESRLRRARARLLATLEGQAAGGDNTVTHAWEVGHELA